MAMNAEAFGLEAPGVDTTQEARLHRLEVSVARLNDKLAALESLVGGGVAETLAPRPDSHSSRLGRLEWLTSRIEKTRT